MATARLRSASSLRGVLLRHCSVGTTSPPQVFSRVSDLQAPGCIAWKHFSTFKPNPLPKSKQIKEDDKDDRLVYQGPISSTIRKVKLLSLSTCCLSVSLGPVITFMTSPDMNVILKGAVASTVIFLSATTTAALHWFVSPYIHKLRWRPGSDSFEAEIMSWLATPLTRTIKFADVRPPETNRPFVTFRAEGNFYFVDAEHFPNKALLARLTPKHPNESAFKNL
ncbi:Os03g0853800 [Oryza sativa Japonica Group]|uniref:Os03g0853800 protein n=2 Tax=Oryza sativa subsp. japonica TaxID=39947 RepID=Q0DLP2_ORYSJ|nr:hypothetical protein EE612_021718 [Oryza sativa]BAF13846.1 Os03g0853800 [Oryza sativa Japonica Group]BAS87416.1 Os03g0853800 [Oryza sativa Japonica Group]|eukprot:NP_001051932.1 Os03g0853800 [Oryza sativa Japonica Group]